MFCTFIKRFDLYGKKPEFYYKGKSNKTTWIGRVFTLLYITIYIIFLIYKLNRMAKRKDLTFYETNTNNGEIPSIKLNKDIFYTGLAFDYAGTDIPFVDDRIYTISGKYINQVKINGQLEQNVTDISFKKCELSDFGKNYQSIFANKNITQMLCPLKMDYLLEGYYTMERYSYIKLNYKRCVNTSENKNHCYPSEEIDKHLYMAHLDSKIQDIELTPHDYHNPVQYIDSEISGTAYKNLYPMVTVEIKIVIIETDNNLFGFETSSNTKTEKYVKYDSYSLALIPSIFGNFNENLNEITIQLSPNILTQKRTYVQLIDVLGDVGGLMETVNMIFSIICSLIVNISYDKSLVNNLFNFDLNKKIIILKHNNIKTKTIDDNINKDILSLNKNFIIENQRIKRTIRKNNSKKELFSSKSNSVLNKDNNKSSKIDLNNTNGNKKNRFFNYINTFLDDKIDKKSEDQKNKNINLSEKNDYLIKTIKLNILCTHFGFCCLRSINNINNILLDEGMKIITEELDIVNIFRILYKNSKTEYLFKEEVMNLNMSDESKKKLAKLINYLNNSSYDV